MLYDLRATKPTLIKDHHYEFPINSINFCSSSDNSLVLSSDRKGVKVWHEKSGELLTAVEPQDCEVNAMCLYPDSGLVFMAAETQKMHAYFIPVSDSGSFLRQRLTFHTWQTVGPAPKWCSFLENLTEEMEEDRANVVYDDYKFVTRSELDSLGLTHLIGSKSLRAYMHGYFVNVQLYMRAKQTSEPFAYEEFKMKKIKENMEHLRSDRVKLQVRWPAHFYVES